MNTTILQRIRERASDNFAQAKVAGLKDRLGIAPKAQTTPTPTPTNSQARTERPYAGQEFGSPMPSHLIFAEIYRRAGIDPKTLVAPETEKAVKNHCKEIDELQREFQTTFHGGDLLAARRAARDRLKKGKGSLADSEFDAANWREAKKALRRQIRAAIEAAAPPLVEIAQSVQEVARRVLPQVEAESERLGIAPHQVPLVREIARACWVPAKHAAHGDSHPRQFLKQLGIKL